MPPIRVPHWTTLFFVIAFAVLITATSVFQSDEEERVDCRGPEPKEPAFNRMNVSYERDGRCRDYPMIDAYVLGNGSERKFHLAGTPDEHNQALEVVSGDILRIVLFFHNVGSLREASKSTAVKSRVAVTYDMQTASAHRLGAVIGGQNSV